MKLSIKKELYEMKFIKNYLLGILIFFCNFILFYSPGNTQENLNDQEAETQEISRQAEALLQDESIKNDNIFFSDQTEKLDVESVDARPFPVRLRAPNNSHSDDYSDFDKPQGVILEYRHEF